MIIASLFEGKCPKGSGSHQRPKSNRLGTIHLLGGTDDSS